MTDAATLYSKLADAAVACAMLAFGSVVGLPFLLILAAPFITGW